MNKKIKAGFDLDDIIPDFFPSFVNFHNGKYGHYISVYCHSCESRDRCDIEMGFADKCYC